MNETRPDRRDADGGDERWLARVRGAYAPPTPTPAERAAFDARLHDRLAGRRRGSPWLPIALGAGLATAALAAFLALRAAPADPPADVASGGDAWADELLLGEESGYGETQEGDEALPPQYAAIASVWLER
jgi:hypothetical protein